MTPMLVLAALLSIYVIYQFVSGGVWWRYREPGEPLVGTLHWIDRDEHPILFWGTIAVQAAAAGLLWYRVAEPG